MLFSLPKKVHGPLTIRMYCNWPLLNVQLMVNEAWLFTFCHWTHGCDVIVVKNYLKLTISFVEQLFSFTFWFKITKGKVKFGLNWNNKKHIRPYSQITTNITRRFDSRPGLNDSKMLRFLSFWSVLGYVTRIVDTNIDWVATIDTLIINQLSFLLASIQSYLSSR